MRETNRTNSDSQLYGVHRNQSEAMEIHKNLLALAERENAHDWLSRLPALTEELRDKWNLFPVNWKYHCQHYAKQLAILRDLE